MQNTFAYKAEEITPEKTFNRDLVVKLNYCQLVFGYLNDNGENFSKDIIRDFAVAKKVWTNTFE